MADKKIGAGCIFTDGKLILAGLQRKQKQLVLSGIGGKRIEGETPHETAIRETVEELFNVNIVPPELMIKLMSELTPIKIGGTYTYTTFTYSFEDLAKFLTLSNSHIQTTLYKQFPLTLHELMFGRLSDPTSEIQTLSLVPVHPNISFDPYFVEDINRLIQENTS